MLKTHSNSQVRVVWFANMNEHFNISIPYIQIASVKTRDSKFGLALVIESSQLSGGYVLGFRVDPADKLSSVAKEISSMHSVYSEKPVFGVEYDRGVGGGKGTTIKARADSTIGNLNDLDEIADDDGVGGQAATADAFSAYVAEGGDDGEARRPVFCPEFGLSIEELKDGYTLESLWQILPPDPNKKLLE